MNELLRAGDTLNDIPETTDKRVVSMRRAGRPRQVEANQLGNHVLAAARRSFVERGFGHTTIERVASDSGTTRRSVMHRFANRDALLVEVARNVISSSIAELLAEGSNKQDPLDRLRMIARGLLAKATDPEQIALFRVYLGEIGRLPQLSEILVHHNNELEAEIERVVSAVQESGKFRRYSAAAVATSAIGMMLSNPINRSMMGDPKFREPRHIDHYFSQMWAIFLLMA
jgi:AcrR family transcriptional regulator